jgi:hypothetical protein
MPGNGICRGLCAGRGVEFPDTNVHRTPQVAMIRLLAFLGVLAAASVFAQAPIEERRASGENSVSQGQQRLEFLRREMEGNQEKVRRAELEFNETKNQEAAAQKQLDAARKRREATGLTLDRARRDLAGARKGFENESAEFERMLKGGAAKDTGNAPAKK